MSDVEMTDVTSSVAAVAAAITETATTVTSLSPEEMTARVYPNPANPYTFDLGHLLVNDSNPISRNTSEAELRETARSAAQALINQLLTACPITNTGDNGAPAIQLPGGEMLLPREKPVPVQTGKEKTKWEAFAERRGITATRRDARTNMEYDEATGEWAPKWGFGGKNMRERQSAWLEELDENGEKNDDSKKKKKAAGDTRRH